MRKEQFESKQILILRELYEDFLEDFAFFLFLLRSTQWGKIKLGVVEFWYKAKQKSGALRSDPPSTISVGAPISSLGKKIIFKIK